MKGKPPRWLTLGLGALVASKVEPGSPYYRKIRRDAVELCNRGWGPKATDALADQEKTANVRAVGFAMMDWLAAADRSMLGPFVGGMSAGGNKSDATLGQLHQLTRQEFLFNSGEYVMMHYRR